MRGWSIRTQLAALSWVFALGAATSGEVAMADQPAQELRSILILARVLSYDRALPALAPTRVVVGVVFDPNVPMSIAEANSTMAIFAGLPDAKIFGEPISAVEVPVQRLADQISGVQALYLCGGLEGHLADVMAISRANDRVTLTTHASWVSQGVSVGVRWNEGNGTIQVNLPASQLEGADFGSDLLKLAEVIR